ncbi:hypothetical protein [Streptomyces sp.]|uniref:hypothetical protein n=1 Tax=Streptomyces sp. TaxID=1931 RepID=UPI0028125A6B|nr:hypothetical protein [Streptomyces sp.]
MDAYDRLTPLGYLPMDHPELALDEHVRLREDERWAGLTAVAGGGSYSLADPALAPLRKAMDADARTLLLHPGTVPDPRLSSFYLANLLGKPAETALAAAQLVFGDILATHRACASCRCTAVGCFRRSSAAGSAGPSPLASASRTSPNPGPGADSELLRAGPRSGDARQAQRARPLGS